MKIGGAIFDVDGTLLDSMFVWDSIGEVYLRALGYEPEQGLSEKFKNMSLYQAACYYKSEYGVPLSTEEIMHGVNRRIEHYYNDVVTLKKGVPEFLEKLHQNGVRMCIATATDEYLVESALTRCGIRNYFSALFTCTSVGHAKDSPVIYERALASLGTARAATVVFEDALYAARTAKAAGFPVAAIFDAHEIHQDELKATTDYYFYDFTHVKEF